MVTVRPVVRRGRRRDARLTQSGGVRIGRRGRVLLVVNGRRVTDQAAVLAVVGRKV